MTDEDDIIILTPDEEGIEEMETEAKSSLPKWPIFLGLGVVLGGFIVGAAAWHFQPEPFNAAPLQNEIQELRAEVETLKSKPAPIIPEIDLGPLNRRVSALENLPDPTPIDETLVARLEALQAEGFEVPEFPDVTVVQNEIADLSTRVTALESAPPVIVAAPPGEGVEPFIDPATLPSFPEKTLREGAAELAGSGFARRLISRHVRVRGAEAPDRVIDAVMTELEAGRPRAALAKFDTLPPELAALAPAWRANMEDALEAPSP